MPERQRKPAARVARASTATLWGGLRDHLKKEILSGRLAPGQRLPSESDLGGQFDVSRITVRLALADLQREGLVVKQHGKGSFVSLPPVVHSLARLKGLSETLSGAGRTIHTRLLSLKSVEANADTAAVFGLSPRAAVTEIRTLRYLNRKPLVLNQSWLPPELGEKMAKADLANRDILGILEQDLGLAIGEAELSIGAINAGPEHRRLLGVPVGAALVFMRRMVCTADKRPVHLEQSAYRGDLFTYSLKLKRGGR